MKAVFVAFAHVGPTTHERAALRLLLDAHALARIAYASRQLRPAALLRLRYACSYNLFQL